MADWSTVADSAPEFAAQVKAAFEAHKHKTIATLRANGSPRISGIEADFVGAELWFGSMSRAVKALDLQRDARFALHSASVLPTDEASIGADSLGDAKISGRAVEVTDRARVENHLKGRGFDPAAFGDSHFFTADIHEVVLTRVEPPLLVIQLWRPGQELRRFERE